jgi:hypothetical protein
VVLGRLPLPWGAFGLTGVFRAHTPPNGEPSQTVFDS